jgi:hypothetical protein
VYGCLNDDTNGCCGAVSAAMRQWWVLVGIIHVSTGALLLLGALGAHVIVHKILLSPVLKALTERHCKEVKIRHTERKEYVCMLLTLALLASPLIAMTSAYCAGMVRASSDLASPALANGTCDVPQDLLLRMTTTSNGTSASAPAAAVVLIQTGPAAPPATPPSTPPPGLPPTTPPPFPPSPPPPSPPPLFPGGRYVPVVEVSFNISGTIEAFDADAFTSNIAAVSNTNTSNVCRAAPRAAYPSMGPHLLTLHATPP